MKLKDVLSLSEESIVTLDRMTDELLDVMVNGKLIARGEVVAQGDRFGLRIVELMGTEPDAGPALLLRPKRPPKGMLPDVLVHP
jgi:flagellar motor switch protein FliN/FliY